MLLAYSGNCRDDGISHPGNRTFNQYSVGRVYARSQAPAWECRLGSSSFQSREAGASASGFPSWSLETSAIFID